MKPVGWLIGGGTAGCAVEVLSFSIVTRFATSVGPMVAPVAAAKSDTNRLLNVVGPVAEITVGPGDTGVGEIGSRGFDLIGAAGGA